MTALLVALIMLGVVAFLAALVELIANLFGGRR